MSRQLPAVLRPERSLQPERPEVIVVERDRPGRASAVNPIARLILNLAPDVIRAVDRSRSLRDRDSGQSAPSVARPESRTFRSGVQLSEVEYDLRVPFVRKVTVRKATAWTLDTPSMHMRQPRRSGRLRRAGLVSVSAVLVAVLGVLANRGVTVSGLGERRWPR